MALLGGSGKPGRYAEGAFAFLNYAFGARRDVRFI